MPPFTTEACSKKGKLDRSSRSRSCHRTKVRRVREDLDPDYKPANTDCGAWLHSVLCEGGDFFPRRRSTRLNCELRTPHERGLTDALDRLPKSETEEESSEISDFLDLEDGMISDLDFFDGVDCMPTHTSRTVTAECIETVDDYGTSLERLRTPTNTDPSDESEIQESSQEVKASPISSESAGNHRRKSSGRRKTSNKICPVCQKSFQQLGHLRSHFLLHTGEKPFVCEICEKSFVQSGHLISHINSHTSNRPYGCDFCDKRFTQSGHKRNHERSHLGIRPYGCVYCDKRFTQSGHLVNHLRIHVGDKPYKCEICGKAFTQSGHLSSHKKTHMNSFDTSLRAQLHRQLSDTFPR